MDRLLTRISAWTLAIGLTISPTQSADRSVNVTFLVFSDIYDAAERNGRGGFARLAGIVAAERAKSKNVIVAHAGDTISPSLLSAFDQGAHIIALTNLINPDIFVPGNHEFDFGEDVFRKRMAEATFPRLAANLHTSSGEQAAGFADNKVFDIEGVKVGVFGLTDDESARRSRPGSFVLAPSIPAARQQVEALRKGGADIVVAVTHSSWQDDLRLAGLGVIDVILSGHDHNLLVSFDGKSVIAETQADGANVVAVDVAVTVSEGDTRKIAWSPKFRIIDSADATPDPIVATRVSDYELSLDRDLNVILGTTQTPIDSRKSSVRGQETAIGNFFAEAMRSETGADLAIINGGAIRGDRVYDAGTRLSRRDIFKELPFGNKVVMLELTGKDLRDVLENAVRTVGKGDGRFGQIAGGRITGRKDGVPGSKLTAIEIGGAALDDRKLYKVATNDFMALGKEGYDGFTRGKWLVTEVEGRLMVTVVMDAIQKAGTIAPIVDGRITLE